MIYKIDAKNKALGRLASEAAVLLMGKKERDYNPRTAGTVKVEVINAGQIRIDEKKDENKKYRRYSGYAGGLRETTRAQALKKKGIDFVLRKTIMGMLPKNRLRKLMIKNLIIK